MRSPILMIGENMFERKKETRESKIIDKLIKENQELREQLKSLNPEMIELAKKSYNEYTALIKELDGLKQEYKKLLNEMEIDKEELLKACK